MNRYKIFVIALIALISLGVCAAFVLRVERIDAGCVGIKVNLIGDNRGVDDVTEVTGWIAYMPLFTQIHEFPTYTQVKDYEPFYINAKDGSEFTVDPTFSYYVDRDLITKMFKQYRRNLKELENSYIRNVILDCYRIVANQFSSDSLIGNRQEFEYMVQTMLQEELKKEGFIFQQLTSNMTAPQTLKDAIDAKNRTMQEAIQAENKLRQAEAEAKAKIIAAEAEKKVNDLKASALTPLIIQQMFIEKWDGKLPQYGTTPQLFKDITK
ncbi:MAG: SPFH domain-containing protein [Bacteroidaceae bacterium]|nr:SPFH domain-containing protein [Bacteroidaceae bacterium]